MQRALVPLLVLIGLVSSVLPVSAGEADHMVDQMIQEQMNELNTEALDEFVEALDREVKELFPSADWQDVLRGQGFDLKTLGQVLVQTLFRELLINSRLLGQLIVLAVLCSLLQNLQVVTVKGSLDLAFAVCFLVLTYIGLASFREAVALGARTIDQMATFMYALLPVLSTSLAATGAVGSATVLHPMLIVSVELVAMLVTKIVFPLLFCAAVLAVAGNFSEHFPITRLASLFQQATVVCLTLGFTAFLGVMAVRGSIAPVVDGVTLRTAKYITGTFIPVVGKLFADSVEVVVGGSLLIKNAVGFFGMAAVIVLVAFPLVKIASILVIYKVVTALIQPISDQRLVSALSGMGNSLAVLFAAVGTVAVMFFVAITVLVGVGNLAATMR